MKLAHAPQLTMTMTVHIEFNQPLDVKLQKKYTECEGIQFFHTQKKYVIVTVIYICILYLFS